MIRHTLLLLFTLAFATTSFSQCDQWANPSSEFAYEVFDEIPCTGDTLKVTSFQVWQSDAYQIENVLQGATLEFNHCDSAGAWIPEYTVYGPSGEIEAFGSGENQCSFTWTAQESGTYIIAVNEADSCGVTGSINNGFPSLITTANGAVCPPPPVFAEGAESFESDTLPECWTVLNEDANLFFWFIDNGPEAFEGQRMMRNASFLQGFGAIGTDDWLISPPRVVGENDSLYYVVSAFSETFPNEFYSVLVAVNSTEPDDFVELFSETLSSTEWKGRSIDLSDYAGQTVYIAFRHHNSFDQSSLLLDAIALPGVELENCDVVLSARSSEKTEFSLFPNPSNGQVTVGGSNFAGMSNLQVFDLTGSLVYQQVIVINNDSQSIDLSNLERGAYLISISNDSQTGTEKLIIQ
jgi:hypothetical protein